MPSSRGHFLIYCTFFPSAYKIAVIHLPNIGNFHSLLVGGYWIFNCETTDDSAKVNICYTNIIGLVFKPHRSKGDTALKLKQQLSFC